MTDFSDVLLQAASSVENDDTYALMKRYEEATKKLRLAFLKMESLRPPASRVSQRDCTPSPRKPAPKQPIRTESRVCPIVVEPQPKIKVARISKKRKHSCDDDAITDYKLVATCPPTPPLIIGNFVPTDYPIPAAKGPYLADNTRLMRKKQHPLDLSQQKPNNISRISIAALAPVEAN